MMKMCRKFHRKWIIIFQNLYKQKNGKLGFHSFLMCVTLPLLTQKYLMSDDAFECTYFQALQENLNNRFDVKFDFKKLIIVCSTREFYRKSLKSFWFRNSRLNLVIIPKHDRYRPERIPNTENNLRSRYFYYQIDSTGNICFRQKQWLSALYRRDFTQIQNCERLHHTLRMRDRNCAQFRQRSIFSQKTWPLKLRVVN